MSLATLFGKLQEHEMELQRLNPNEFDNYDHIVMWILLLMSGMRFVVDVTIEDFN